MNATQLLDNSPDRTMYTGTRHGRSAHPVPAHGQTAIPARPVLVVIGPSGSGKSSIVRELHSRQLIRVHPTWTTRGRRPDEADGSLEHRFVSDAEFDGLTSRGFFLETMAMFGLPYRYGLSALPIPVAGKVDAVMLRAPLVRRFTRLVANVVVYQIEDAADRMNDRLVTRPCAPAELAARIEDNRREVALGREVADRVFINDGSLDQIVETVGKALRLDMGQGASRSLLANSR